jgi:hypothetical protein
MFALAKTERWISGKAPLGYKLDRFNIEGEKKKQTRLVIDEATAPHVQMIFEKYIEYRSITQLETFLLQNHIKSQNGKDMTNSQLALILKNPSYVKADERIKDYYLNLGAEFYGEVDGECGLMSYGKTKSFLTDRGKQGLTKNDFDKWIISVGTHHGIVEADVWLETQRILKENHDKFPQMQKSHTALVSGIIRCAECGNPMTVQYGRKNPDGTKGFYYACKLRRKSKGVRCTNKNARADLVDMAIIKRIKARGLNKDVFLAGLKEQIKQDKQDITLNPTEFIEGEITKKNKQIDRLVERVSNTDNDDIAVRYENQIRTLEQEIIGLSAELKTISEKKTTIYQTQNYIDFIEKLLDKFNEIDQLDLDRQREVVNLLIKRIEWDSKAEDLFIKFKQFGGGDDDNDNDGGGSDDDDDDEILSV